MQNLKITEVIFYYNKLNNSVCSLYNLLGYVNVVCRERMCPHVHRAFLRNFLSFFESSILAKTNFTQLQVLHCTGSSIFHLIRFDVVVVFAAFSVFVVFAAFSVFVVVVAVFVVVVIFAVFSVFVVVVVFAVLYFFPFLFIFLFIGGISAKATFISSIKRFG